MVNIRRARGALLLCAVFLLAAASPGTAHAAAAPSGMFGFGAWTWPDSASLERQSAQGVLTWRVAIDYAAIGRAEGRLDFGSYDALVLDAARRNVRMFFVLTGCPAWSCPSGGPPTSGRALSDWQAFVSAAVRRYGSGGSLWAANPSVAPRPVRHWQVFNEVNGAGAWPNPSAATYAAFLVATAPTIRAADRQARIVTSGLPEKMTIWMKDYLPALYAQPGFKASTDIIAVHGYTPAVTEVPAILDTARRIMLANGDGATPLWVTEMAWSTGGPPFPFTTTEAAQADNLRRSWTTLVGCRARWKLQRVYWFGWRDPTLDPTMTDYWGYHVGVLRRDGTAKPALAEADRFTRGADVGAEASTCLLPGGTTIDTAPPDTTIVSGPGASIPTLTPTIGFASDEPDVTYECRVNANGFVACPVDADGTWTQPWPLWPGTFTFDVRARDATGNVDPTPASTTFIIDQSPPDTYVAGTWGNVVSGAVSLTLSGSEPMSRYECRIDDGAWRACTSPFSTTLPKGSHTISVRGYDLAGWVDPIPATPWYQVPS